MMHDSSTSDCLVFGGAAGSVVEQPNALRVSHRLEEITMIDRENYFTASRCQNRPDTAGRLHALVSPPSSGLYGLRVVTAPNLDFFQ